MSCRRPLACAAAAWATAWAAGCGPAARERAPADGPLDQSFADPRCAEVRGYRGDAMEPFLTRDGRWLLYNSSNAPGAQTDLHAARVLGELAFEYAGPVRGANSGALDAVPTVTRDGTLFYVSTRSYDATQSTIFRARFADGAASGAALAPGLPRERGVVLFDVEASADGRALYYARGVFRGGAVPEAADLHAAVRSGDEYRRSAEETAALDSVNSAGALEYAAALSADGRELFFTRLAGGEPAIYRSVRARAGAPFGRPGRVAAIRGFVEAPALSADGERLYYHQRAGGRFVICHVRRVR